MFDRSNFKLDEEKFYKSLKFICEWYYVTLLVINITNKEIKYLMIEMTNILSLPLELIIKIFENLPDQKIQYKIGRTNKYL